MRNSLLFLIFLTPFIFLLLQFHTEAAPAAPLVKHLSSVLKWTRSSPKQPQSDGNVVQFESGYLVETLLEGNALGVLPHAIRVSQDGELFAVDAVSSNIVKITPPLSQYSRARLVAGSFQGYAGHIDGKPSDARFNHPKGVTMDDKGNVYVADTSNLAIRKIGEAGVTTIAGGKSNIAGYMDGPSEDAKFSSDFDVVYVGRTCSLLVVDRGNAALRQISLNQDDCDNQHSSITSSDVIMVIGAVLIGYVSCIIQQGIIGLSLFSKTPQASSSELHDQTEKPTFFTKNIKEDQDSGWSSVVRLIIDLSKFAGEALNGVFLYVIPASLRPGRKGLTPLKDNLAMPEDKAEPPPLVQKHRTPVPTSEPRHTLAPNSTESYTQHKLHKIKPTPVKDASSSTKHRSKRQDFAEFYGSSEAPSYGNIGSKSQKERTRHRHRDRSGEVRTGDVSYGGAVTEPKQPKPVEVKPVDYSDSKFDHYNIRNKYGSDDLFNF